MSIWVEKKRPDRVVSRERESTGYQEIMPERPFGGVLEAKDFACNRAGVLASEADWRQVSTNQGTEPTRELAIVLHLFHQGRYTGYRVYWTGA